MQRLMLKIIDVPKDQKIDSIYEYNNILVPRVTSILSAMLHEDYLMKWSNSIGLYQHKKYEDVLNMSADIGSFVHSAIEKFLSKNEPLDINNIPLNYRFKVNNAFNSFLLWWNIISSNNDIKILMTEETLVCKYFGGTLDLLIQINGKIYLVDFKTSNHPSYKYFLQLSAYRYMLRETKNINIDGCIILMLDKSDYIFREMPLIFENQNELDFMNRCEDTFMSLVFSYYQRLDIESGYKLLFGGK